MLASTSPAVAREPESIVLAGRYTLEREIARGSMGVVYVACDGATGKQVALKRLLRGDKRMLQMFEREFHTLVGLQHPRIIEVYDYVVADGEAYYTMELLDGSDLRELAPLDYKTACAYLRDVASSLALLHARRLLHRDVSPRNVRVTSDGRAKLIDFGGLAGFGVPDLVVGTAPYVPPEALHYVGLDQRADLYALGALSYWLLTGRNAYHARELAGLPDAWRTAPPAPSEQLAARRGTSLPAIPPALDDLVVGLLTLNPLGRPASAADVIDRLSAIGQLPREHDSMGSRSYLLGVETVGREREKERLDKRLRGAVAGRGSCMVIDAAAGMGTSRLLGELAVRAQLQGALPVVVDGDQKRGPYAVVHAMISQILRSAPGDARRALGDRGPLLARFSPELAETLDVVGDASDLTATPGELRKRTQGALGSWLMELSKARPLVIAVDNAQRLDDGSAALLATLALGAGEHPLLLVVGQTKGEAEDAPGALKLLRDSGSSLVLRGLESAEVQRLVELLFGSVPHSGRLAAWMHRLSAGSPRACMELAEHLVASNVIRYVEGGWVLPQELHHHELPDSLEQLTAARIDRLEPEPRALAEALSVHRGPIPLVRCVGMAAPEGIDVYAALARLEDEHVLANSGDSYRFTHDALRAGLLAGLDGGRGRDLHLRLGRLIEGEGRPDLGSLLEAGWHLLQGGDESRGADLLASAGLELQGASDDMNAAVPALRAALAVYQREGRSDRELVRLLAPLAMAGYYTDRRLADEFGPEALRVFRRVLGIDLMGRLKGRFGKRIGGLLALGLTGMRFVGSDGLGGPLEYAKLISSFHACCTALAGAAAICLDADKARRYAEAAEPLVVFGPEHGSTLAYRFAATLSRIAEDRMPEIREELAPLLARLDDPRPIAQLPPDLRLQLHGGVLYLAGVIECYRDPSAALAMAERLDGLGLQLYEMVADQLRTQYHALRGESERADFFRQRVERHAVQAGSAWQVEVWVACQMVHVCALSGDTIGLKRVAEVIDRLAEEIPSLRRYAVLARGEYHHLKGEHERGFELVWPQIEASSWPGFAGRTFAISNHLRALNACRRYAEGLELADDTIAHLGDGDRAQVMTCVNLFRERAHALLGLGRHEEALAAIDELLAVYREADNPLLRGSIHTAAAAIAIECGDVPRALESVVHVEHAFRPTSNPTLISQCERLRRAVRRMVDGRPAALSPGDDAEASDHATGSVRSILSRCHGREQRGDFALRLALSHVRGESGYLFSYLDGKPKLLAPLHGDEPPPALLSRVRSELTDELDDDQATKIAAPLRSPLPPALPDDSSVAYRCFALTLEEQGELRVVGMLAVVQGDAPLRQPEQSFLRGITRSLFDSGDIG